MEEKPVAPPRKVRFVPKIPARRPVTATTPKIEVKKEEEEAALTRDLLRRINEGSGRGRPKDEKKRELLFLPLCTSAGGGKVVFCNVEEKRGRDKSREESCVNLSLNQPLPDTYQRLRVRPNRWSASKGVIANDDDYTDPEAFSAVDACGMLIFGSITATVPVQVAFGHGNSSRFIRSYGPTGCKAESLTPDDQNPQIKAKEYKEPWNYYTYYPVVHPLRRPYSGNPELLDAKEFGVASKETEAIKENVCDENLTKPAVDLGLMDEDGEDKLLFIHLPRSTPILKQSAVPEANEVADMKPPQDFRHSGKGLALDELPRGLKGKLLVYKSGLTKLKVGNTVYDVFPGSDCKLAQESDTVSQRSDCTFAQDLMAVNTGLKRCDVIGEVTKRAIMTPNVNSFLNSISLMD
ncbi:hypothetical protein GIB67_040360 [Kingdonia uniflora]|uniref:DNA-directed RNA polymerase III subunit RPC4 n=1 Tax=Kingdonia uniflora TaxID=39325 RepID=A0A7J7L9D4_9MAGN|nr:hypothetical protein GIB67_040360 [Kingdonia uniflora]